MPFWISHYVHHALLGAILQAVSGGGLVVLDVLAITALQRDLPRAVLGRALAATGAVALAATVVSNLAASAVISTAGLSWALALIGIGFPLIALACLPVLVTNDRATLEHTRSLQPLVELLERLDLFDGASHRVLEQLAAGAAARTAQPGEVLITQGSESTPCGCWRPAGSARPPTEWRCRTSPHPATSASWA